MKTILSIHVRTLAIAIAAWFVGVQASFASPFCLPPGPVDAGVLRAAPEECLFYLGWNGAGKVDGKSENQTEQLLAEKEIQTFVSQIDSQVTALVQQAMRGNPAAAAFADDLPALVKGVLTRPVALYVSKVAFGPMGPDVKAGLVINTGDMQPAFAKAIAQLEALALTALPPGMKLEELDVAGAKLHRAPSPPGAPVVVWGFKDSYFLISVGADAGQELVKRLAAGSPPAWLANVQQQAAIKRPGTTWYVNLAGILQTAGPFLTDPKMIAAIDALGIQNVKQISSVSGFDRTGMTSKTSVATKGELKGIFAALAGKPLTAADLHPVPKEVNFAIAARLDAAKILSRALEVIANIDPAAREQANRGLAEVDTQLGVSLTDDVLAVLGDVWCAYGMQPKAVPDKDAPQAADFALTVTVRDRKRFDTTYQALISRLKQAAEKSNGAWEVKQSTFRGQQVYYVPLKRSEAAPAQLPSPFNFQPANSGLTPCWCLTDERLVVCSNPQGLKDFLIRSGSAPSLAAQSELATSFKGSGGPLLVTYSDTAAELRSAYPQLQALLPVASAGLAGAGLNFQIPALPSLATLERHARPSILLLKQTQSGFLLEDHQTVPIVNARSMATSGIGIALLLPAVQAAREAARRTQSMNNLKQIGVAMQNFHDVFKRFPASTYDKDGKPLLSWRVHILPFVEAQALYQQFHLDEPWDSEHNKPLVAQMPAVFRNPNFDNPEKTVYLACTGEHALFADGKADKGHAAGETAATIVGGKETAWARSVGLADIADGTSNTIMVVEANPDQAVIWTKPDDLHIDADKPMAGLGSLRPGGFNALLCDGSVRFVSSMINLEMLKRLFNPRDGMPIQADGF